MANSFFLFTLKNILTDPAREWERIEVENRPVSMIRNGFLIPLFIVIAICATLGSVLFINTTLPFTYSIFTGLRTFVLLLLSTYLTAYILYEITAPLDLGRNFEVSFRLVAYSIVPLLLCQIVSSLFESLLFVNVLALYGLYIFWTGSERMLTPPAHKKIPLLVSTFITFVIIFIGGDILLAKLFDKIFYLLFA